MDDGESWSTEIGNKNRKVGGIENPKEQLFCCIVCISTHTWGVVWDWWGNQEIVNFGEGKYLFESVFLEMISMVLQSPSRRTEGEEVFGVGRTFI